MNDEEIYDLLIKKLIENIPIMRNYEVVSKGKKISKKITIYTAYDVALYSDALRRKVSIGIVDYYDHKVVDIILYKVLNYDKHIDGSLSMYEYLTKHLKTENAHSILNLSNNSNESLDMKLQVFFDKFLSVVDELFFKILEGKEWIEIPFDWEPYK